MNILNSAACLASVILFSSSLHAAPLKVFLLAGQSNMRGMGNPADLKAPYTESPATVKIWEGNSWMPMVAKGKTFRNAKGVFKSYPFSKICADPPKTQDVAAGPIGDFWRTWYSEAKSDFETVTVKTTRDKTFTFSIKDGNMVKD